jgi:lysophospholipase L1-like esterase
VKLSLFPVILGLAICAQADEEIVTLGDSLTFSYQVEFGAGLSVPGVAAYLGDDMGSEVLNWIEILSAPEFRRGRFDQGGEIEVTLAFFWEVYLRREYNWAIPGTRIDDLRRFLAGEVTVTELLVESDDFGGLRDFLLLSDFGSSDYDLTDLEDQLADSAERVVFFIGGNDVSGIYRSVYEDDAPGTFVADFLADATWIVDWVLARNPNIEFVLVNVPHIGITPLVKSRYPTDPVKTARVTAVLEKLNDGLTALAAARAIGYADVYQLTLPLLSDFPFGLQGLSILNSGSVTGDLDFAWLNGQVSDNFHPNTNVQALLANEIIHAFNDRYHTGIAPLTASEILGGLLGKLPSEIDMPIADWMSAYGLSGESVSSDHDRDGMVAGLEFALGLDPTRDDADRVKSGLVEEGGADFFQLSYPTRLATSAHYTLTAMSGAELLFAPLLPVPAMVSDGLHHARLPVANGKGFLRLEVQVDP